MNRLTENVQTRWLGRHFEFFPEIDSTNRYLQANAADRPHGAVALTDFQSEGRGRLKRQWTTPPGTAILMSVLLKPDWPAERLPWLAMIAGLAVVDALTEISGVDLGLKWPNDVVVPPTAAQPVMKVAGILLESAPAGGWVIGLGINVNQEPHHLPAAPTPPASVRTLAGHAFDREPIIQKIWLNLEDRFDDATRGTSPLPAWRAALINLNQPVTVHPVGEQKSWPGHAVDVDESGRLLVKEKQGVIHPLAAGDVSLRPE